MLQSIAISCFLFLFLFEIYLFILIIILNDQKILIYVCHGFNKIWSSTSVVFFVVVVDVFYDAENSALPSQK